MTVRRRRHHHFRRRPPEWFAYSPDLNPIEQAFIPVWALCNRRLYPKSQFRVLASISLQYCACATRWPAQEATRRSRRRQLLRPHRPGAVKAEGSADDLVDGQGVIAGRGEQLGCPKLGGQLSDILSNIDFQSCWCNFELAT